MLGCLSAPRICGQPRSVSGIWSGTESASVSGRGKNESGRGRGSGRGSGRESWQGSDENIAGTLLGIPGN